MGQLLMFALLVGGGFWLFDGCVGVGALDPRGVGTRVEGRDVVSEAGQLEVRFSMVGSLDESYMLFGGDATQHRNSFTHAIIAGLPIREARMIASRYPDFHLCKSPGAHDAQRLTEDVSFVAADRAARGALAKAVDLFDDRLRSGGERTCIRVRGAPLVLESVRVRQNGEDITRQVARAYAKTDLALAQSVQIEDCRALLR
jgi:hypothetical protein